MEQERHFRITTSTDELPEGAARIILRGQFTWLHCRQFRSELTKLLKQGNKDIEIDLMDLWYIDSNAIGELIHASKETKERGGAVRITNPRKLIRHIFISAHLDDIIDIGPEQGAPQEEQ